ncbi:MAG: putative toxin-antitoxin system toxin component, PIN family [Gaiellaceae bacterium]
MQALLDVNVLISALLVCTGAPARLVGQWLEGEFELVVTERSLAELEATLARPKPFRHVDEAEACEFLGLLRGLAEWVADPDAEPVITSRDPKDDYLIAAAASARATLVTGDAHLLELEGSIPVLSPPAFLDSLLGRPPTAAASSRLGSEA